MTDTTVTADIVTFRKRPMTGAERAAAYRARKKAGQPSPKNVPLPMTPAASPVTPVTSAPVTASRAARVTPAVEQAQASLRDAMEARDRECKTGTGKNCRLREDAVTERRKALDTAQAAVEQRADPQVEAARRIVAWLTFSLMQPSGDDFAMLRLILLSLLPQIGGILLMVARGGRS